jgi:hypothetical protein
MPTYDVYANLIVSHYVGQFDAESDEEAMLMAGETYALPLLCHECSTDLEIDEVADFSAEEA